MLKLKWKMILTCWKILNELNFFIVKDESFILKALLFLTCASITITPSSIRCTSNQDIWSKENTKIQDDEEYVKNLKNSN